MQAPHQNQVSVHIRVKAVLKYTRGTTSALFDHFFALSLTALQRMMWQKRKVAKTLLAFVVQHRPNLSYKCSNKDREPFRKGERDCLNNQEFFKILGLIISRFAFVDFFSDVIKH